MEPVVPPLGEVINSAGALEVLGRQFWVTKEHVYIPPPITGPGSLSSEVWIEP